jgi:TonB family protein
MMQAAYKTYWGFCFFCFFPFLLFGQNGENPLPFVYEEPKFDTAPQFPGGSNVLINYLQESIIYPQHELEKKIEGNVLLKFMVSEKGDVYNVQVLNGVPGGANLAAEAKRVISQMPKWIPARKNGKNVEAEYILSVPFYINNKQKVKTTSPH